MLESRKVALLVVAPLVLLNVIALTGSVAGATRGDSHKIRLCHATHSETNPYVTIEVDVASVVFKGHDEHEDIIPPFEGYPGKNYSGDNILIYLNDCEVPSSTTSTTTPTTTSSTIPTTTTTEVVPTTTTTVVLGTTVPIPTTTTTILPEVEIFGTIIPSGTTTTIAPVLTAQEAELPKTGEGLSLFFAGLILVICGYLLKKAN